MLLLEAIARAGVYEDQIRLRLGHDLPAAVQSRLDRLSAEGLNVVVEKVAVPVL